MHHTHVCNILKKNTFTDATGISSLWWMLVFIGSGVDYGFIQSSIAYTPMESFPHILLQMSGPGNVF